MCVFLYLSILGLKNNGEGDLMNVINNFNNVFEYEICASVEYLWVDFYLFHICLL